MYAYVVSDFIYSFTLKCIGRFDLRIPDFVVDELKLTTVLEPLLSLLRSIMTVGKKAPTLQTHNVVFVPVGSKEQVRKIIVRIHIFQCDCTRSVLVFYVP
jgi:hypothetical protein